MNNKYISRIAARMSSSAADQYDDDDDDAGEYSPASDGSSPAADSSPALESPAADPSPALESPALESPTLESPASDMSEVEDTEDVFGGFSDGLEDLTEYSSRIYLDLTVDFEGEIAQDLLLKTLKQKIRQSLQSGMQEAANELKLSSVKVKVMPIKVELSILDEAEYEPVRALRGDEDDFSTQAASDHEDDGSGEDEELEE